MTIWVGEVHTNATQGHRISDHEVYESNCATPGAVYRDMRAFYKARCTGRVYVDGASREPRHVGWVFVFKDKYDDTQETFLHEVWVTLYSAPPTKHTEYHYMPNMKGGGE